MPKETGRVYADLRAGAGFGVSYVDNGAGFVFDALMFDVENLTGGSGADLLFGQSLDNTIQGGGGADQIWGEDGNDTIFGGLRDDVIFGGNGNDVINFDDGTDSVTGGAGADDFVWSSRTQGADVVNDFSHAERDQLVLDHTAFGVTAGLNLVQGSTFLFGAGVVPTQAAPTVYFDTSSNLLWFDLDGTGSTHGAQAITFLANGGGGITAGDIVFA